MPSVVNENSGLATASGKPTFWTHNDSGGKPELYEVDMQGTLLRTLHFPALKNVDWEEVSRDERGTLYIGDIGNNQNMRRDLTIYKIPEPVLDTTSQPGIGKITFQYEDQKAFPPERKEMNFDCEAFFFANDSLYLFSKNRGDHHVKLYTLPAVPGQHVAKVKDRIELKGMVTAADISPDRKTFAVLTYGKIFFFGIHQGQINFSDPLHCLKVGRGQIEGLVYVTNNTLLMSNEQGNMYWIRTRQ
ncbi:MAG: hypothetical protein QM669_10315 [Siphonobacter sp.]